MLKIKEITNKKIWDNFLTRKEIEFFPFFQSWNWGEIQKKLGREVIRIGLFDDKNKLVGLSSIIEVKAKRGHYFHLRHGPVLLNFNERFFNKILDFVKKIANERKVSFIRISPLIKKNLFFKNFFKKEKFIDAPIHNMDAETCLVLDITKTKEELLKNMRKTHRYLIRKGINMNIKIVRSKKESDINIFLKLYKHLYKRKKFVPHKDIKEEFEVFCRDDQALLIFTEHNNQIVAGVFILFVGNMAIYHHGASLDKYREIPFSYLLQWESILEAKKRGKKFYNFWGIAPLNSKNHPWEGLTLFKTGFGGETKEFIHAQDLPLNIWYWKSYLIEYLTKIKRGYVS